MEHPIIDSMKWRYATKKFDTARKISAEDLNIILESLRLTASSYGLQPVRYVIVEDKATREKLMHASYGQSQVMDASHLIIIGVIDELTREHIDDYINLIARIRDIEPASLSGFHNMIRSSTGKMNRDELNHWISSQAYIALGQLMHTCADMRIDSTPMEGFQKEKYDEILNLKELNLRSVLVCPIGYRHPDDPYLKRPKVRQDASELFIKK